MKPNHEKTEQTQRDNNLNCDLFFFNFVFTIQGHNPCLAVQLARHWVTRQPWLEAAVVRGPCPSAGRLSGASREGGGGAKGRGGEGGGHRAQSAALTLMGFDRTEATRFAVPPLPPPPYLQPSARLGGRTGATERAHVHGEWPLPCRCSVQSPAPLGCRLLFPLGGFILTLQQSTFPLFKERAAAALNIRQ